ncbi:CoA transferase [Rhodococcus sp. 06-156-3C]|uniref:CaiB/BaiF CoA transferase family protein n=1 Tax=Nocardiaceae TaxID=85025 RepID=UPI000B236A2C|nr:MULTISPECIES: CoA transferase [Rhodococcus]OZD13075.1 CoA transferase [Rhodococcus sp. 06-156-4a]OZD17944.1 CoA transferase [Rhodococcus sp. 06-156-3C]OZD20668.1 CoA transferase [Rhodococcus sp. 06-156-4C]OZD30614.1 CoA transferase [Rhodococcus sp. 06-156-3b]OZD32614.1 CoA transferase [Rhodococcus sp. 06-156-3]
MTDMGRPLAGLRVLDLGQIYAGGYAGFLLASAGADVVKVEPPGGENLRRRGAVGGGAYPFAVLNANKRGLKLDLKRDAGRDAFLALAKNSDVVLENYAPGVMDRLGLGEKLLRELNPRLVYGRASGYGQEGPYRNLPAMDLTVQAMTGVMSTTGFPDRPPVKAGPAIADFMAGVHLYGAIVSALYQRSVTGTGDVVEVTMQESTFPSLMSALGLLYSGVENQQTWRTGNRHSGNAEAPYNTFEALDGYIAILCVTDAHWKSLATIIGGEELAGDGRFTTLKGRVDLMDEVDKIVADWSATLHRADIEKVLLAARVPCSPVKELPEVVADPNLWHRGMLREMDHPELGPITAVSNPMRFGYGTPDDLSPSPMLGQHSREVLSELLGYSDEYLDELEVDGAI